MTGAIIFAPSNVWGIKLEESGLTIGPYIGSVAKNSRNDFLRCTWVSATVLGDCCCDNSCRWASSCVLVIPSFNAFYLITISFSCIWALSVNFMQTSAWLQISFNGNLMWRVKMEVLHRIKKKVLTWYLFSSLLPLYFMEPASDELLKCVAESKHVQSIHMLLWIAIIRHRWPSMSWTLGKYIQESGTTNFKGIWPFNIELSIHSLGMHKCKTTEMQKNQWQMSPNLIIEIISLKGWLPNTSTCSHRRQWTGENGTAMRF